MGASGLHTSLFFFVLVFHRFPVLRRATYIRTTMCRRIFGVCAGIWQYILNREILPLLFLLCAIFFFFVMSAHGMHTKYRYIFRCSLFAFAFHSRIIGACLVGDQRTSLWRWLNSLTAPPTFFCAKLLEISMRYLWQW